MTPKHTKTLLPLRPLSPLLLIPSLSTIIRYYCSLPIIVFPRLIPLILIFILVLVLITIPSLRFMRRAIRQELKQVVETLQETARAGGRNQPLGRDVVEVLYDGVYADGAALPAEAVAEVGWHLIGGLLAFERVCFWFRCY